MVVENAFGTLKGRWRCLLKTMDYYEVEHTVNVFAACVVLHNICELQGGTCDPDWIQESHAATVNTTTTTNNAKGVQS